MNLLAPVSDSHIGPVPVSELLSTIVPTAPPKEPWHIAGQQLRYMVLQAVTSQNSKRNYAKALDEILALCAIRLQGISRPLLMDYRASMIIEGLKPFYDQCPTCGGPKLVGEARGNGILDAEEAAKMADVLNARLQGRRMGNWLTRNQAKELLAVADRSTLKGKRDYCILLVGCALRRRELASRG